MALIRDAMVASYGTSRLLYTLECHPCASLGPIQLSVQAYTVLHVGMRPIDLMKYHSGAWAKFKAFLVRFVHHGYSKSWTFRKMSIATGRRFSGTHR